MPIQSFTEFLNEGKGYTTSIHADLKPNLMKAKQLVQKHLPQAQFLGITDTTGSVYFTTEAQWQLDNGILLSCGLDTSDTEVYQRKDAGGKRGLLFWADYQGEFIEYKGHYQVVEKDLPEFIKHLNTLSSANNYGLS